MSSVHEDDIQKVEEIQEPRPQSKKNKKKNKKNKKKLETEPDSDNQLNDDTKSLESNDEFVSVNSSAVDLNDADSVKEIEVIDPNEITERVDNLDITDQDLTAQLKDDNDDDDNKTIHHDTHTEIIDLTRDDDISLKDDKPIESGDILDDLDIDHDNDNGLSGDQIDENLKPVGETQQSQDTDTDNFNDIIDDDNVPQIPDESFENALDELKEVIDETPLETLLNEEPIDDINDKIIQKEIKEEILETAFEEDDFKQEISTATSPREKIKEKLNKVNEANNNTAVSPPLPSRRSINSWFKLNTSPVEYEEEIYNYSLPEDNQLFLAQLNQINREFQSKNEKDQEQIKTGTATLRKTFNEIKLTIENLGDLFGYKIDWDFWTQVVNDYQSVVINDNLKLNEAINNGIPKEVRGMIWQLISNSKNFQLEELYALIKNEDSIHEKSIKRDLSRTSFISNNDMIDKLDSLYNVIKAYSLFDPEVGYTQGMAFITVPLLMNMNESETFCLLVNLMKNYNLRSLFLPEMKGLHLLLYQFDRLLEDNSPRLYNHLVKQGIKSSMYASQWFLTFFAYKFPLDIVLRIYDIIITQGIESILKFAINLLIKNECNLIVLKFESLLDFLKEKLFNYYLNDEITNSNANANNSKRFSFISKKSNSSNSNNYKLDLLVLDSMNIPLLPINLKKYEFEFEEIFNNEKLKENEIELIKINNGKLRNVIKTLEINFNNLNKENFSVTNEMVTKKIEIANLDEENKEIGKEIIELKLKIKDLESKISLDNGSEIKENQLPENIELEIQKTMDKNLQVMEANRLLEEEIDNHENELNGISAKLDVFEKSKKINWFKW